MMQTNKTERTLILALAALVAACGGCGTNRAEVQAFLERERGLTGVNEYRVMPPDVLAVSATPTEEFQGIAATVGPDGRVTLPLVGEFYVSGKTTTEIAAELTERLADYYQDVQVTVQVQRYLSQTYYVFGQVSSPGAYPFTGSTSLLDALAMAQPTSLAMPERIQLIRCTNDDREGGYMPVIDEEGNISPDALTMTIDLNDMIRKGDFSMNVLLGPNDVIYVPANPLAKVGLSLQSVLFPAATAIQTVGVPNNFLNAYPIETTSGN